jgi:hypothetical protein
MPALGFLDGEELSTAIKAYQAERGAPPNTCASWPHCKNVTGVDPFCHLHRKHLDAMKGKKPAAEHEDAPIENKCANAEAVILKRLDQQQLSIAALAEACACSESTFGRARKKLIEDEKIIALEGNTRTFCLNGQIPNGMSRMKPRQAQRDQIKLELLSMLSAGPITPKDLRDAIRATPKTFLRALQELLDEGKVIRTGGKGRSHNARYQLT